jgi:hypothetical protein
MRRVLFQKYVRIALEAINSTSVSLPTICRFATAASLSPKISDREQRLRLSTPVQAAEIKFQPVPPRAIKLIHGGLLQNRCEKAAGTGNSLGAAAWPRPPAPASRSPPHNISTPLKTARHRTISQM